MVQSISGEVVLVSLAAEQVNFCICCVFLVPSLEEKLIFSICYCKDIYECYFGWICCGECHSCLALLKK